MRHGTSTAAGLEQTVSRRAHPYFGRLNRLEEARKVVPGTARRQEPEACPTREPGLLWDEFRATD